MLRDDAQRRVPVREIVPGDVLLIGEGDRVAADARLATGMSTEIGRLAALSERVQRDESPLERQVRRVAWLIAGLAVGVAFLAIGLAAGLPFGARTLGHELCEPVRRDSNAYVGCRRQSRQPRP